MNQFDVIYNNALNSLSENVSALGQLLQSNDHSSVGAALAKLAANKGNTNSLTSDEKDSINKFSLAYQNITSTSPQTSASQPTQQTTSKTASNPINTQISTGTIINPVNPS